MKILILINSLYPETIGGIEKIGADLACHLAANHEVVVFAKFKSHLPVQERRNNFLIKRIKTASDYKFKIPLGVRSLNLLRQLKLEEPKPDIILSMGLANGFVSYLSKSFFKIPFVIYILGSDWYIARDKKFRGKLFKLSIKKCDTLMTQTGIVKRDVLKHFPEADIEVIPNGINLPGKRSRGDKIIYIGRLQEIKGIAYLIDAVSSIKNCPELIITGSGPEENKLKSKAKGMNISFAGRVHDVEEIFMQGRFLVLPSLSEGLPQVILEAMSYGLPVIATKVGGIPDVIEHGKTGFLVQPGDSRELQKYIEVLLSDEQLCHEMGDKCFNEVNKYSWTNIISKLEGVMSATIAPEKL